MYNYPCSKEYLGHKFVEWAEARYTEDEFDEIGDSLMCECVLTYRSIEAPATVWLRLISN